MGALSRKDESAPVAQKNCHGSRTPERGPARPQEVEGRQHGDEDAGEERRHLEDRVEREAVGLPQLRVGARQDEHERQADHRDLAPGRRQERHGGDDAREQQPGSPCPRSAAAAPRRSRASRSAGASRACAGGPTTKYTARTRPIVKSQGAKQAQRPGERHAEQVAQEERRIAERRQAAADVRHQEDEEDHGVGDVLALAVRLQQRAG